jgi:ABC-type amino acid transport substrate-binding protein
VLALWLSLAAALGDGEGKTLRIASDATFPPFHYVSNGAPPTGYDIELARRVAKRAGFELPWRRRLAQDGALLGRLTRIVTETVLAFYAARAALQGWPGAKSGAVTVVQRPHPTCD